MQLGTRVIRGTNLLWRRPRAAKMQDLAIWQDFVHQEVDVPLLQYAAECMRMWPNERSDANVELFLDLGINGWRALLLVSNRRVCRADGELALLAWKLYGFGGG